MPINAKPEFFKARGKYNEAQTTSDKLKALYEMLRTAPNHKGSETLRADIKTKISKYKKLQEKERLQKKKAGASLAIKKEGAATICIVGMTNTGKSSLLKQLTNKNVKIADYPFTTRKPEIGTMDYNGIKIQVIEVPAITENYLDTEKGPQFLGVIRLADLLIIMGKPDLVLNELHKADINKQYVLYNNQENIKDLIWENLDLIKVFTKEPGKKVKYPPLSLKKDSSVRDMAEKVHKDFIKKFNFARIWGSSSKFDGQIVGLDHVLEDDDIVELHIK